jgi:hypothetical protein
MISIKPLDSPINQQQYGDMTYRQYADAYNIDDRKVPYGPDMFYLSINTIAAKNFTFAVDGDGELVAALAFESGTYAHRYTYSGGVDTSFIDNYDCIFLYDCNEFSVELCRTAFRFWKGKRLVLVGINWEKMIEYLDDIPDVECFYEIEPENNRFAELMNGFKCLHVTYGIPHQESMERYEQGIMYYDEIMSFTFMFSDYRELGDSNPDKYFFVMDGYYGNLGLFTIRSKIEVCLRYALSKGMEPVVRIVKSGESFYSDYSGDDIWGKFFNQLGDYSLDDVMHSKHVFFSPGFYNGSVQSNIMSQMSKGISLDWKHGVLNNNLIGYIAERKNKYLPYPQRTLGVLARGTDFVNTHLHNHPIHASKEMIADRIDEALRDWNLDYVYIATEDAVYCEFFKERYGDKVFFTDQQRYVTRQNELLSELHRSEEVKRNGFELGAEYAASINLLSQCNSLIASGGCGGVDEALRENADGYEHVYVFDLGTNR